MSHEDTVEQSVGSSPVDPPGYIHLSAAVSDTGRRQNNQDSYLIEDDLGLYVVADGVGGHQGGDVASAMATSILRESISAWRADESDRKDKAWSALHKAMESACSTIYEEARSKPKLAGMSTTLTAVLIDGNEAVVGHVGDSRLYLLRNGSLEQISSDHTLAAELYRGGVITREKIDSHPHSHVLTRNVGSQGSVMIETLRLAVRSGDLLLLCSDGLNPALDPHEHVVDELDSSNDLAGALSRLVERAKEAGSRDNITAVVWRRDGGETLPLPVVGALRSVPLLAKLSLADLTRVAAVMTMHTYEAGQVLIEQGAPNGALHVVLDGRLRWTLPSDHFAHLERGNGIGSTTLVAARRCPATLMAAERTNVLMLKTEQFRNLCQLRPRLGTHLLTALADELSDWIDPDTDRGVARPPEGLLVEY